MTKAVLTSFHNYVPMFPHDYFDVLLNYYIENAKKYWLDEVDKIYLLDSNWDIKTDCDKVEIIKSDPNLRYYDAYKKVIPDIKEDAILMMDNDMVIEKKEIVKTIFSKLEKGFDVVSIYDTIGKYRIRKLRGKSKFCPYLFAVKKDLIMKYLKVSWAPNMPDYETLGLLTKKMLRNGAKPYEILEDKSHNEGKWLGYYHVRAGSTIPYLLTHRNYGNLQTYRDYIEIQPAQELRRHIWWYKKMGGDPSQIEDDLKALYE